jgi:hypothetical protein
MSSTLTSSSTTPNHHVAMKLQELIDSGAQPVESAFSPGIPGQGDLVHQGRRLFITANDDEYQRYATILSRAGLPFIANDPVLGDEHVVVGEIDRDARLLSQIIRSRQPEGGPTRDDVFFALGSSVQRLIETGGVAPAAESLSVGRTLVLRARQQILFTPPLHFSPVTERTTPALMDAMARELADYARFGGAAMLNSFGRGLGHGGS